MPFNIEEFAAYVHTNGVLKTNKMLARIHMPNGLWGRSDLYEAGKQFEIWCMGVTLPGLSLRTSDVIRYGLGHAEKKPFGMDFKECRMTFISNGNASNLKFFSEWMRLISNYDLRKGIDGQANQRFKPFELSYKYEYETDVNIIVYDDAGKGVREIILRQAYPIAIGDVNMNWQETNTFMQIPVVFTYFDWYDNLLTPQQNFERKPQFEE